ncbi:MAG TPA: hypothetical protein VHW64_09930 [Nocardioides sp.]|jgi:hypothetical protein|uniref:hypothetical protein n=1 Tax=Nocardioides sp. TaxID=35761 RepID=UPI002E319BB4|nr:hypothetical protein [Nocardioides sp.]HEX3931014.1 hypothetical protein [Nocardioides sp.]
MSEPGTPAAEGAADAAPSAPSEDADPAPRPAPRPAPEHQPEREQASEAEAAAEPSWWHRSHPTFAGLVGFFSGVAYVIVVPGIYAALLGLLLSDDEVKRLFPLVLVALLVPVLLLVPRKTRRFAQFMLLGVVATAVVIVATAALVIWVMVQIDG